MPRSSRVFKLALLCAALMIASCRTMQEGSSEEKIFLGTVYMVGHEPFAEPAIQTADGKIYRINGSEEVRRMLMANQGHRVRVKASEITRTDEVQVLKAVAVEIVPE